MKNAHELSNPYAPPVQPAETKAAPTYRLVGSSFKLGRWNYSRGHIIFSSNALFLIPKKLSFPAMMFLGWADVFGELTGRAIRYCNDFKTDLEELTDDISHPDWPIGRRSGLVFRIPQEACVGFRYSWLTGIISRTQQHKILVVPQFVFFSTGTKQFLVDSGWTGIGR